MVADRFEDLRNYVAVVDNGGVNAAAQALGIAKSAVSRRLGELEARLGVTLVERGSRKLQLTATGRDYHLRAKAVLASLDELDRSVGGGTTERTQIAIEIVPELGTAAFSHALTAFIAINPTVSLKLASQRGGDTGIADLSLTTGKTSINGSLQLGRFRSVLYGAPGYLAERGSPISVAELAHHSAVVIDGQTWLLNEGLRPSPAGAVTTADADAAAALAIAGAGLAQLPDLAVREHLAEGRLVAVLMDRAPVTALNAELAPDATALVRRLADHLAANLPLER